MYSLEERVENWRTINRLMWKDRGEQKTSEKLLDRFVFTPIMMFLGLTMLIIGCIAYAIAWIGTEIGLNMMLVANLVEELAFGFITLVEKISVLEYKTIKNNLTDTRKELIEQKFEEFGIAY